MPQMPEGPDSGVGSPETNEILRRFSDLRRILLFADVFYKAGKRADLHLIHVMAHHNENLGGWTVSRRET